MVRVGGLLSAPHSFALANLSIISASFYRAVVEKLDYPFYNFYFTIIEAKNIFLYNKLIIREPEIDSDSVE